MAIVLYEEDGRIREVITAYQASVLEWYQKNHARYLLTEFAVDPHAHFVKDGVICFRPVMQDIRTTTYNVELGKDSIQIEGLPDPCTLRISDNAGGFVEHEITGGTLSPEFEDVGLYTLYFSAWPYLDRIVEVNVIPRKEGM